MIARNVVIASLALLTAAARAHFEAPAAVPAPPSLAQFPAAVGAWEGRDAPPFEPRVLALVGVDDYLFRIYRSRNALLGFYVGYYRSQRHGDSIHSPMNCLPGAGWQPVSMERLTLGHAAPWTVNKVIVEKDGGRQLVLYWYQTRNRVVASEYWSKAFLVVDALASGRSDAALVRIAVPIDARAGGEAAAQANAMQFGEAILPLVGNHLFQM